MQPAFFEATCPRHNSGGRLGHAPPQKLGQIFEQEEKDTMRGFVCQMHAPEVHLRGRVSVLSDGLIFSQSSLERPSGIFLSSNSIADTVVNGDIDIGVPVGADLDKDDDRAPPFEGLARADVFSSDDEVLGDFGTVDDGDDGRCGQFASLSHKRDVVSLAALSFFRQFYQRHD